MDQNNAAGRPELGLDGFGEVSGDQGLSLERLSGSFARLFDQGRDPYEDVASVVDDGGPGGPGPGDRPVELSGPDSLPDSPVDACPVTPRSILEAVLFVGHPDNQPLSSREIAKLMRGVRPAEVDQLVRELNAAYAEDGSPYSIESLAAGYRMTLRRQYQTLREKFYGKLRQARLSQSALDVLAIVAYRQPVLRAEVDRLRGRPSGGILAQLVRRQLLRIEHQPAPSRAAAYFTTDRFLAVFGLESLDDLPREQDLDLPSAL